MDFKNHFQKLWTELFASLSPSIQKKLETKKVALIFASTKGMVEDFIWQATENSIRTEQDPFQSIIDDFCSEQSTISWQLRANISNACSSTHVACEYIQTLFEGNRFDFALLLSGDLVGPFVYTGFQSLKIISPTTNRPFSGDREGLQLGEAISMILFSREKENTTSGIELVQVASQTEAQSVTRPSMDGKGLAKALESLQTKTRVFPDLIIAHGTGTKFNDLAEDLAFHQFFAEVSHSPPITGTKWCIGHTLGASGAIDMIAGCEVLKKQRAFKLQNTPEADPKLKMNYLTANSNINLEKNYNQVLISSLGFGGVHAGLVLQRWGNLS
jgi:3-oxoacyl-(acyl-carrier-protein) synthase